MQKARKLKIEYNGEERHFRVGDTFILNDYRRETFIYHIFEYKTDGVRFVSPSTIRKQFEGKMKIWFITLNNKDRRDRDFAVRFEDERKSIIRSFAGVDYSTFKEYDIKSCSDYYMVFLTPNQYEFLGVYKAKDPVFRYIGNDEFFDYQEFYRVAEEIKFTPKHSK